MQELTEKKQTEFEAVATNMAELKAQMNVNKKNVNIDIIDVNNVNTEQPDIANKYLVNARVNKDLYDKIKYQSEQSGISVSAIIRDVLEHTF